MICVDVFFRIAGVEGLRRKPGERDEKIRLEKKKSWFFIPCLSQYLEMLDRTNRELKITAENMSRLQHKHNSAFASDRRLRVQPKVGKAGIWTQQHLSTAIFNYDFTSHLWLEHFLSTYQLKVI